MSLVVYKVFGSTEHSQSGRCAMSCAQIQETKKPDDCATQAHCAEFCTVMPTRGRSVVGNRAGIVPKIKSPLLISARSQFWVALEVVICEVLE
jgi:hypothetical protein